MTDNKYLVSIVIVNYNGLKYLKDCLNSISQVKYPNFEVLVVDNNSTDGSVRYLKKNFIQKIPLRIIENRSNVGVSEGFNIGIQNSRGFLVSFLNNDTVVDPHWLDRLLDAIGNDQSISICQSKILKLNRPDIIDSAGDFIDVHGIEWRLGGELEEEDVGQYDRVREIFSARGAAMTVKKNVFDEIGVFDPLYFAGLEDVDFCWRAHLRGLRVILVPESIVYHRGEGTRRGSLKAFHSTKNRLQSLIKNYDIENVLRYFPSALLVALMLVSYEMILTKSLGLTLARIKGILWVIGMFKQIWRRRMVVQYRIRRVADSQVKRFMQQSLMNIYVSQYFRKKVI